MRGPSIVSSAHCRSGFAGENRSPWTDLKTVVQIDPIRATDDMTVNRAFSLTSQRADPKQLAARIRDHWGIENQFAEAQST